EILALPAHQETRRGGDSRERQDGTAWRGTIGWEEVRFQAEPVIEVTDFEDLFQPIDNNIERLAARKLTGADDDARRALRHRVEVIERGLAQEQTAVIGKAASEHLNQNLVGAGDALIGDYCIDAKGRPLG